MKIKITEDTIKHPIDGKLTVFSKDDQVTVPDEVGELFCARGWATDIDGTVETGERKPGANGPIVPDKIVQDVAG